MKIFISPANELILDSRNGHAVQVPLDGAVVERINLGRRAGCPCDLNPTCPGQARYFSLGMKTSLRNWGHSLSARQRNNVRLSVGNRPTFHPQITCGV